MQAIMQLCGHEVLDEGAASLFFVSESTPPLGTRAGGNDGFGSGDSDDDDQVDEADSGEQLSILARPPGSSRVVRDVSPLE